MRSATAMNEANQNMHVVLSAESMAYLWAILGNWVMLAGVWEMGRVVEEELEV